MSNINEDLKKLLEYDSEHYYYSTIEDIVSREASRGKLMELADSMIKLRQEYSQSNNMIRLAKDVDEAIARYLQEKRKLMVKKEEAEDQQQRNNNLQKRLDEGV
jgi:hypothetical protein